MAEITRVGMEHNDCWTRLDEFPRRICVLDSIPFLALQCSLIAHLLSVESLKFRQRDNSLTSRDHEALDIQAVWRPDGHILVR